MSKFTPFHECLTSLGFSSYDEYLAGEHWQSFRQQYRESSLPQSCAVCREKTVSLHHITYESLGKEALRDVVPLCQPHHEEVHERLRKKGLYVDSSWNVIGQMRKALGISPLPHTSESLPTVAVKAAILSPARLSAEKSPYGGWTRGILCEICDGSTDLSIFVLTPPNSRESAGGYEICEGCYSVALRLIREGHTFLLRNTHSAMWQSLRAAIRGELGLYRRQRRKRGGRRKS